MRRYWLFVCCIALLPRPGAAQTPPPAPYRDAARPVSDRVRDLLGRMTLDEKFWQLFLTPGDLDDSTHDYSAGAFGLQIAAARDTAGARPVTRTRADAARAHAERVNAIQRFFVERSRLGVPIIAVDEAVHGLMRDGATVFPAAIALAATWDTALVANVARATAREARSRGVRQVLSPVINVVRDVRWGRVEETYGEDTYLTSLMGQLFVAAFERAGIVATPKHFVANVGEGGRDSYPIEYSERLLQEVYLPPFKDAVQQAHARAVMTAYNSVDGSPATQSRALLNGTVKRDWGFTGFIISDAGATGGATVLHHTEATTATSAKDALDAGLDVIFQSSYEQHRPWLAAFRSGTIADSVIDAAVARVLRVKFELGLFERPYVDADSAAYWNDHADHRALALDAARASIVLLQNERHRLPLARTIHSIAVIGADAVDARLGGYTAPGATGGSILDGIRAAAGSAAIVRYARGPGRTTAEYAVVPATRLSSTANGKSVPGVQGEYWDNNRLDGTPTLVRTDPAVDFQWTLNSPARGIPYDWYSARWTGTLTAPPGGVRRLGVEGNDGYRLFLDGKLLIDNWVKQSHRTRFAAVSLAAGTAHALRLEYFESTGNARVKLVWDAGARSEWRASIDSAVAAARQSTVAVIVAGIEEGEFRDRALLNLPGHQEELIARVAATGRPVVVVLIGGSAITIAPWIDRVDAIVEAWYPGEQGGRAVADVLFGAYNPAGRLPITFPAAGGQVPLYYNHKPTGRGDDYVDLTGQPLFPFGFGLSYTRFAYSALAVEPVGIGANTSVTVRCTVKNEGDRAGDEVVQLYLHRVLASVARPVAELHGFRRVRLEPGQERDVAFVLTADDVRYLDRDMHAVIEPGVVRVMIGSSSRDIRLRGELIVR